ncbi:MAG TPA: glycerophosphodiester phosphodiesterase family protein [Treponemataceae bacterium]|nr:glycerophosphodiester phosphodiesterase family protein [Treponemataceae bacterium]HQF73579.1 glycerophosphodiester phosphodiesterase family protein [Treponemataceae bacterium]
MKMTKNDTASVRTLPDDWPRILAHRGASSLAPENTLPAFQEARRLGCRGVELDVHRCKTGELVVVHDHWLDRICGQHLHVESLTLAELRELDAGSHFNRKFPALQNEAYAGERFPLFDEVLETLGPDIFLDVELKLDSLRARPLAESVALTLSRHNRHNCIVSSFNPLAIRSYRKFGPHATAAIYCRDTSVPFFLRHRECLIFSNADIKKPAREIALASAGFETGNKPVIIWTVNDRETVTRMLDAGVTSLITDRIQDFT